METTNSDGIVTVAMVPRFDAYTAKEVETFLQGEVSSGTEQIICDFSHTDYISSAGLRVLLAVAKALKKKGGSIALCALKPPVREVFEIAGFTSLFPIYSDEKEARTKMK